MISERALINHRRKRSPRPGLRQHPVHLNGHRSRAEVTRLFRRKISRQPAEDLPDDIQAKDISETKGGRFRVHSAGPLNSLTTEAGRRPRSSTWTPGPWPTNGCRHVPGQQWDAHGAGDCQRPGSPACMSDEGLEALAEPLSVLRAHIDLIHRIAETERRVPALPRRHHPDRRARNLNLLRHRLSDGFAAPTRHTAFVPLYRLSGLQP